MPSKQRPISCCIHPKSNFKNLVYIRLLCCACIILRGRHQARRQWYKSVVSQEAFVSREAFVALLSTTGPTMISGVNKSNTMQCLDVWIFCFEQLYCNIDGYKGIWEAVPCSAGRIFPLLIMKNAKVVSHSVKLWKRQFQESLNFFSQIVA